MSSISQADILGRYFIQPESTTQDIGFIQNIIVIRLLVSEKKGHKNIQLK